MAYVPDYTSTDMSKVVTDKAAVVVIETGNQAGLIGLGVGLALVAGAIGFAVYKFKHMGR